MRKLITIYTLAVLLPSLLLAALALRAQGGQELVIRQQRALVHQATVDALAAEAAGFLQSEHATFTRFAETAPQDWPTPATHFTVSAAGDLTTPPADLGENRDFLWGDATASIYNIFPKDESIVLRQEEADKAFETYRSNVAKKQSTPQRGRSLFKSKRESSVDMESARIASDSSALAESQELRTTAPQSLPAPVPTASTSSVRTTAFSRVVAENPSGTIARYVGSTLYLIYYHRLEKTGETHGAIIEPTYLRTAVAGLVDIVTGAPEEACIALLDGDAKPIATNIPNFIPQDTWRRPFVAAEIGSLLPRWEVAAYFTDPSATRREARAAWLRIALAIGGVLAAITGGGLFIALAFRRQLAEARQKTDFVSNVSHELKTPLTSIRMFSDLLASPTADDPEKRARYAGVIQAEAARLGRLINNVLDFSRLERGTTTYRTDELDPLRLLRETLAHFQPTLEAAGFAIESDLPDSLPAITGDADALSQIIVNLLSNAEKYSPDQKQIRIAATTEANQVSITIADRGQGISKGWSEKIFEQFTRADDSLTNAIPGSGLGLALSRSIARAHHGDITYRPRPGGGSIFEVSIPTA